MAGGKLSKARDPKFPKYVYAAEPLVASYDKRKKGSRVATMFIGEWMKVLDKEIPEKGRVRVRYRGGVGYVDRNDLSRQRLLEIYFIDVDQGDSILIQTPDDRRVLIDGGQGSDAHNFIRNKYNLYDKNNYIDFDAIVATHSDSDHTQGLIGILKDPQIAVKRVYHNGLFTRVNSKTDPGPRSQGRVFGLVDDPKATDSPELKSLMKKIVAAVDEAKKNLPEVVKKMRRRKRWKGRIDAPPELVFKRLDAADRYLPPFKPRKTALTIEVLWPAAAEVGGTLSYPWYGDAGKTVNGNSVVLLVRHGRQRILLTGDLNAASMDDLCVKYRKGPGRKSSALKATVYKAAHHGSQDFSVPFLKTVSPSAAVISSGDNAYDRHGHPRAVLLGTITRYSKLAKPAVFSTELAACYSPIKLTAEKQKELLGQKMQVYERAIKGIVHLRSDRKRVYLGTVHGRRPPKDEQAAWLWNWDVWPDVE
jgi:beta-lactamase superfamily II metal-dependent hydrolase